MCSDFYFIFVLFEGFCFNERKDLMYEKFSDIIRAMMLRPSQIISGRVCF